MLCVCVVRILKSPFDISHPPCLRFGKNFQKNPLGSQEQKFLQYLFLIHIIWRPVLRIRIRRIHMFLGLLDPDPDPLVRGTDLDPFIIKQKSKKTLIPTVL